MTSNGTTDMTGGDEPHYVRLNLELIVEITDGSAFKAAALRQVQGDEYLSEDERAQALNAVELDPPGALAHFIDPLQMLEGIPGIDLTQASWESSHTEYDPETDDWDLYDLDDGAAAEQ